MVAEGLSPEAAAVMQSVEVMHLGSWLQQNGLERHKDRLVDQSGEFGFRSIEDLRDLDEEDVAQVVAALGMNMGERNRFTREIRLLRQAERAEKQHGDGSSTTRLTDALTSSVPSVQSVDYMGYQDGMGSERSSGADIGTFSRKSKSARNNNFASRPGSRPTSPRRVPLSKAEPTGGRSSDTGPHAGRDSSAMRDQSARRTRGTVDGARKAFDSSGASRRQSELEPARRLMAHDRSRQGGRTSNWQAQVQVGEIVDDDIPPSKGREAQTRADASPYLGHRHVPTGARVDAASRNMLRRGADAEERSVRSGRPTPDVKGSQRTTRAEVSDTSPLRTRARSRSNSASARRSRPSSLAPSARPASPSPVAAAAGTAHPSSRRAASPGRTARSRLPASDDIGECTARQQQQEEPAHVRRQQLNQLKQVQQQLQQTLREQQELQRQHHQQLEHQQQHQGQQQQLAQLEQQLLLQQPDPTQLQPNERAYFGLDPDGAGRNVPAAPESLVAMEGLASLTATPHSNTRPWDFTAGPSSAGTAIASSNGVIGVGLAGSASTGALGAIDAGGSSLVMGATVAASGSPYTMNATGSAVLPPSSAAGAPVPGGASHSVTSAGRWADSGQGVSSHASFGSTSRRDGAPSHVTAPSAPSSPPLSRRVTVPATSLSRRNPPIHDSTATASRIVTKAQAPLGPSRQSNNVNANGLGYSMRGVRSGGVTAPTPPGAASSFRRTSPSRSGSPSAVRAGSASQAGGFRRQNSKGTQSVAAPAPAPLSAQSTTTRIMLKAPGDTRRLPPPDVLQMRDSSSEALMKFEDYRLDVAAHQATLALEEERQRNEEDERLDRLLRSTAEALEMESKDKEEPSFTSEAACRQIDGEVQQLSDEQWANMLQVLDDGIGIVTASMDEDVPADLLPRMPSDMATHEKNNMSPRSPRTRIVAPGAEYKAGPGLTGVDMGPPSRGELSEEIDLPLTSSTRLLALDAFAKVHDTSDLASKSQDAEAGRALFVAAVMFFS